MSDGEKTITFRFHWSQLTGHETSDVNILLYQLDSDRLVAELTMPQKHEHTVKLIHAYRHPDTRIDLPASFLNPSTTQEDRVRLFREAIIKAAAD